ncbi:MAG: hypothetical protein NC111_03095 [Bacteroides sp.]|nr:hypothetical protein [Bacteroides sp.]MCM1412837.1 hypothetical protein [Bacteroides sp.]MCM1471506.1 hypothetical protein [Bacteroides sp.]
MKKLLLSIVLMGCAMGLSAGINGYKTMVLNYKDGKTAIVSLEGGMTTKVADGSVSLSCAKGDVVIPTANLNNWTYSLNDVSDEDNEWLGLTVTAADAVVIEISADRIALSNLPEASSVFLAGVDGRVIVAEGRVVGSLTIPVGDLTTGVYVLRVNDKSYKIALR